MVTSIARNRPCSCGSGKKYKLCCEKSDSPAALYQAEDRQSVLRALASFLIEVTDIELSQERFLPSDDADTIEETLELDLVHDSWFAWAVADDREADVIPRFRRRYESRLTPGQRRYIDALTTSEMRVYDVIAVELDTAITLRDRLDRTKVTVLERLATRSVVRGDVIAARLIAGTKPETLELEHPVIPFTQSDAQVLVDDLRAVRRLLRRKLGDTGAVAAMRAETPVIVNEYWMDRLEDEAALRDRAMRSLTTSDGDPLELQDVVFDVRDRETLLARLRGHKAFVDNDPDGSSFTWIEPQGAGNRVLGSLRIDGDTLRAEVMSAKRAARLRRLLAKLCGDSIAFRAVESVDMETMARERDARSADSEEPEIPPDVQAEIVGAFYAQHYGNWPDTPLPGLDGATPREAAHVPALRKRLVAMLRDFDSDSERQRIAGLPYYDFTPVWRELGLLRSRVR